MFKLLNPNHNRYAVAVFTSCVLCGPVALILGCWAAWSAHTKQPLPPQTYIHLNQVAHDVELLGDEVVRLALTGSGEQDRKTLAAKLVDPRAAALPPVPWTVTSTHVIGVKREAVESDSAEWSVVLRVGLAVPGQGTVKFSNMKVLVVSSAGAYKAAGLPSLADNDEVPMQVGPGYTVSVDLHSGIGDAIEKFADVYYVKGGDMGRYVTGDFSGKPLTSTPFSSTSIQALRARSALPMQPQPGDTVDLLATIRGTATEKTWLNMQVPMTVAFTDQHRWAIKKIPDTIEVGKITHR